MIRIVSITDPHVTAVNLVAHDFTVKILSVYIPTDCVDQTQLTTLQKHQHILNLYTWAMMPYIYICMVGDMNCKPG